MSSKEKAKELLKRHINYLCISDETAEFKAKESALITVDEILSFIEEVDPQALSYELIGQRDYWREVLTEIESL